MNTKVTKGKSHKNLIIIVGSIAMVFILLIVFNLNKNIPKSVADAKTTVGGDLIIIKSEITEQMKIYPYQSNDTYMEVIAIKTSDGRVEAALNTCQNCYNTGKGYFTQKGNVLTCEYCGKPFEVDQINITANGCNPVPIVSDTIIEDDEKIVFSEASMTQYEELFKQWKK